MAGKKFRIPGISFSYKRAIGITAAKRRLSKYTGIPTSKAGRRNKLGRMVTGGCIIPAIFSMILAVMLFNFIV